MAVNKGNFYNEDVLQKVAVEDRDDGVRIAAVNKINDESKLVEIAKNEENTKVRNVLLSKIVNPELLEEIALTSQTADIRLDLVKGWIMRICLKK